MFAFDHMSKQKWDSEGDLAGEAVMQCTEHLRSTRIGFRLAIENDMVITFGS